VVKKSDIKHNKLKGLEIIK